MKALLVCAATLLVLLVSRVSVFGQIPGRVDARNLYYRVYCVVPFVGSGTAADPRRPKHALVEFVGANRAALQEILDDPNIQVFERNRATAAQVEAAFHRDDIRIRCELPINSRICGGLYPKSPILLPCLN